jgi:acyl carrier protein
MSEQEVRLIQCFASVFPMSSTEEIQTAGPEWFAASDSLAVVTLAAVIQEEFGVEIDTWALAELNSFDAVLEYIRQRGSAT